MRWNKEIFLLIIISLICLVITVLLFVAYSNNKSKNQNHPTKIIKKISQLTDYNETTTKTLSWIEQQKDENGWYILEKGCLSEKGICDTVWNNNEGNRDGLLATYARFKYFLAYKNNTDLEIIKNDIDNYLKKYPGENQDGLWVCKIAYEIYQKNVLDPETNNNLEKICSNNNFLTVEQADTYWTDRNHKLESLPKPTYGVIPNWQTYSLVSKDFDAYLGYPSEFLSKYNWYHNQSDLDLAKTYLSKSKAQYEEGLLKTPNNICLLGLSSLDMYQHQKQESDLVFAKNIFDSKLNNDEVRRTYQTPLCSLMVKELLRATGETIYFDKLETNNKLITNIYMDGGLNNISNDGGFFKIDSDAPSFPIKNISENSLIINLLINQ